MASGFMQCVTVSDKQLVIDLLASPVFIAIVFLVTMATDCPVTGQMRRDCASACGLTCNNYRGAICTAICVVNGCQCPTGTVINEETNSCIAMEDCPKGKLS